MQKIMILALSAMIAVSASAQEMKKERGERREAKMERFEGKKEFRDFKRDERGFKEDRREFRGERRDFGPGECGDFKKGHCLPPQDKKEFVEFEIKHLSRELYLDSLQEEAFAKVFREFSEERAKIWEEAMNKQKKLDEKFTEKFGKVLNSRQVERVLRPEKPCCHKGPKAEGPGECQHGK